ncbi:DUF998 domain-containing protein [Microlunatus ginsengisoli]|uniref:DUF998 domain-containing protein n=1 Tax=Microlunatus ginsengisoli TaxID=363863 RepID=A0ABP7AYT7_9ACTN
MLEPVGKSGVVSRSSRRLCRAGATAGMVGAALFVAAFLVQGWLRPGYSSSGPFVTDPSTVFDQHSVHGIVHGLFGALVFSLAPASCLVMYRRFRRDLFWRGLAALTLAVGVGLIVGVIVLKLAEHPTSALFAWKGLIQRAILISFLGWVFTVAAMLRRACPSSAFS